MIPPRGAVKLTSKHPFSRAKALNFRGQISPKRWCFFREIPSGRGQYLDPGEGLGKTTCFIANCWAGLLKKQESSRVHPGPGCSHPSGHHSRERSVLEPYDPPHLSQRKLATCGDQNLIFEQPWKIHISTVYILFYDCSFFYLYTPTPSDT